MMKEFCLLTGTEYSDIEQRWLLFQRQILKYAPLEGKETVKTLLEQYNAVEEDNTGL